MKEMKESLFLKRSLMPDETVLYTASVHSMYIVKGLLIMLLGAGVGAALAALFRMSGLLPEVYANIPMYLFGGLGGLFVLWRALWKSTAEIVLTNKRFLLKRGVFFVHLSKVDIFGMDSCEIRQTVVGSWLDYGDILISTVSTADGNPCLPSIAHPHDFTKAFDGMKNDKRAGVMMGMPTG